jgi:signal transduction histidine kinase
MARDRAPITPRLRRDLGRDPRAVTTGVAVAGVAMTLAVALVPNLRFAYARPGLHLAVETGNALVALLAAYLVFGRLRRTWLLIDALLASALIVFAGANLLFAALPAALSVGTVPVWTTWTATLAGNLLAAGLFAAAALVSPARSVQGERLGLPVVGGSVIALLAVASSVALFEARLPRDIRPTVPPTTAAVTELGVGWPVLAVQLVGVALFAVAALGFSRRAERTSDRFMAWLAAGAVLAAVARLNFLYPSRYSQWFYTGDLFRLAFYGLVLAGALAEIRGYWETATRVAVLEERRRIARELHDGLAQELAFIACRAGRLARTGDTGAAEVAAASHRALDESRQAIAALTCPLDERFEVSPADAVEAVAARAGVAVEVAVEPGMTLAPEARAHVTRIACEAVANAARHGAPGRILVELHVHPRPRLRVIDRRRRLRPGHPARRIRADQHA